MSNQITSFGASWVLDCLFGQRQTPPASFFIALLTQDPGPNCDGTTLSEPDPNAGYARGLINNDALSWGQAEDGVTSSTATVLFPIATDTWASVSHYALCDELTGGNVFLYGRFTVARKVATGDQCRIPSQLMSLSVASLSPALVSTF